MIRAASIAMVAALSACAGQPDQIDTRSNVYVLTNENSKGGDMGAHYRVLEDLWETGTSVRIEADEVTSSATFFLAADDAGMANRETVFRFHGPQHTASAVLASAVTFVPPPVSFMREDKANYVRGLMAEVYEYAAPGLGDWFLEHAARKAGFVYENLTATELNERFGVPFCN